MAETNIEPVLASETIELRPLQLEDFDGLYAAAQDPKTWAGHPAKNRYQRDVFEKYFAFLLSSGGTLAIIDKENSKIIGCSRYYYAPIMPDQLSIGFTFLSCDYWGGHTNFAVKKLMLDHAFASVGDVWFHINPHNVRSQKATAKLGAKHIRTETLDLSGAAEKWMLFQLLKTDWECTVANQGTQ